MTKQSGINRRTILKGVAASSLLPLLSANLIGCNNSDSAESYRRGQFLHGVASGDPLADRVILWTRITPDEEGTIPVTWEIATDSDFNHIVNKGKGTTSAAVDYTVKVDVQRLSSDQQYYYRFLQKDRISPTGRTRTLPKGHISSASLAVVSCSNYPAGYFSVYREVANEDVNAVLHLGDYIYEYHAEGYASGDALALGRVSEPQHEIVSLADYRRRYAQYRSDADLQACHARHPFIVVWDDHEVANDAWREGADNHQSETEGSYAERRTAALQAYFEWLPIRPPSSISDVIYRRFQIGDLVDLIMLDTRQVGRDLQINYADFAVDDVIDVPALNAALENSSRHLLGDTQYTWLSTQLVQSTARWQVLGQQVLMGRYSLPAPIIEALVLGVIDDEALAKGTAAVVAALTAKQKAPADRSAEEQALLANLVPYNSDAWDGYSAERDNLLTLAKQNNLKLITLAGDTHNAWASQLTTQLGDIAGVEFATSSVSSPGLDTILGINTATLFESVMVTLVDDLKYANLRSRGFLRIDFTPDQAEARWAFVSSVKSSTYTLETEQAKVIIVNRDTLTLTV